MPTLTWEVLSNFDHKYICHNNMTLYTLFALYTLTEFVA